MIYCKTLLDLKGQLLKGLCSSPTPLSIPEEESDPRTDPADDWQVRLFEFEGGDEPGKLTIALYLVIEKAEFLDYEAEWEDKEPWMFRLVFATGNQPRHQKKAIRNTMGFSVEDQPRAGSRDSQRFWEREALAYGSCHERWQAFAADEHFDAAVGEMLEQAVMVAGLPGFAMDRRTNAFGATGWQRIVGDDGVGR